MVDRTGTYPDAQETFTQVRTGVAGILFGNEGINDDGIFEQFTGGTGNEMH